MGNDDLTRAELDLAETARYSMNLFGIEDFNEYIAPLEPLIPCFMSLKPSQVL